MEALTLRPDRVGYGVARAQEIASVELEGGRSWMRVDQLDAPHFVDVQWTLDHGQFSYLNQFYRRRIADGVGTFTLPLITECAMLEDHNVRFVANSWSVDEQYGDTYVVSAQLEVEQRDYNPDVDDIYMALYEFFNPDHYCYNWEYAALGMVSKLDHLINVAIPNIQPMPNFSIFVIVDTGEAAIFEIISGSAGVAIPGRRAFSDGFSIGFH